MVDGIKDAIKSRAGTTNLGLIVYVAPDVRKQRMAVDMTPSGNAPPSASPDEVKEAIMGVGDTLPEFSGLIVEDVEIPRGDEMKGWSEPLEKGFGVKVRFRTTVGADLGDLKEAADMIEGRIEAGTDSTPSGASADVSIL